jgi:hypothetical protein
MSTSPERTPFTDPATPVVKARFPVDDVASSRPVPPNIVPVTMLLSPDEVDGEDDTTTFPVSAELVEPVVEPVPLPLVTVTGPLLLPTDSLPPELSSIEPPAIT